MARPKKNAAPDLSQACDLTAGAIERLVCTPDKAQAFMRDLKAPGLRVRVTASGAKSYVFEGKLHRQTVRQTEATFGPGKSRRPAPKRTACACCWTKAPTRENWSARSWPPPRPRPKPPSVLR